MAAGEALPGWAAGGELEDPPAGRWSAPARLLLAACLLAGGDPLKEPEADMAEAARARVDGQAKSLESGVVEEARAQAQLNLQRVPRRRRSAAATEARLPARMRA